ARWVKGYSSGTNDLAMIPDAAQLDIDLNGSGSYTIRNADAHSWVEVYFEGYGWIPFEPTANFTMPGALAPEEEVSDVTVPPTDSVSEPEAVESAATDWVSKAIIAFVVVLAAAALAWLVAVQKWNPL